MVLISGYNRKGYNCPAGDWTKLNQILHALSTSELAFLSITPGTTPTLGMAGPITVDGTLTLASGSITDTTGTIDFDDENLSTTGTAATGDLTVSATLVLASGSITDTTGSISFGNENISTTGTLSAGATTIDSTLVLSSGSITDTSGTINFGDENLTTTGQVTAARFYTVNSGANIYIENISNGTSYNNLDLQPNISGAATQLNWFTNDGDGTDDCVIRVWGYGSRYNANGVTNQHALDMRWDSANSTYSISTRHAGTQGEQKLVLYANDGDTNQLVIYTNGYVGIQTTTPSYPLHVTGNTYIGGSLYVGSASNYIYTGLGSFNIYTVSDNIYLYPGNGSADVYFYGDANFTSGKYILMLNYTSDLNGLVTYWSGAVATSSGFFPIGGVGTCGFQIKNYGSNFHIWNYQNYVIGGGIALDIYIKFDGTNDGYLYWRNASDYFEFTDDVRLSSSERLYLRDALTSVYSSTSGDINIVASDDVWADAGDAFVFNCYRAVIGSTSKMTGGLTINPTMTATSGTLYSINISQTLSPTGNSSGSYGAYIGITPASNNNFTGTIRACSVLMNANGSYSGDIAGAIVLQSRLNYDGAAYTGTITDLRMYNIIFNGSNDLDVGTLYGIKIDDCPITSSTATYALYIGDITGAAANYAIYTNSGDISFGDNLFLRTIKSGATQAGAGAAANEIWKTSGHATLPDDVLMIGV